MNFDEVMKRRYSCRKFKDQPVSRENITKLLEAGRLAPSACNSQRWMFIGVDDPEVVSKIGAAAVAEELGINVFAPNVPAFIVVASHPYRTPNPRQEQILGSDYANWWDVDLGIAAMQISITAASLELGSVIMGEFNKKEIGSILELPQDVAAELLIAVGHPESYNPNRTPRREDPETVIRYNSYNNLK